MQMVLPTELRGESRRRRRGPARREGSRASHLKAFRSEGTGPDGSSKSLDAFELTKAANKSSSPGCRWQGRAGRLLPHPATEAQARLSLPRSGKSVLFYVAPLRLCAFSQTRVAKPSRNRRKRSTECDAPAGASSAHISVEVRTHSLREGAQRREGAT